MKQPASAMNRLSLGILLMHVALPQGSTHLMEFKPVTSDSWVGKPMIIHYGGRRTESNTPLSI